MKRKNKLGLTHLRVKKPLTAEMTLLNSIQVDWVTINRNYIFGGSSPQPTVKYIYRLSLRMGVLSWTKSKFSSLCSWWSVQQLNKIIVNTMKKGKWQISMQTNIFLHTTFSYIYFIMTTIDCFCWMSWTFSPIFCIRLYWTIQRLSLFL